MQLREYQMAAQESVYNYLRYRDGNPCVVIPTGGGKTPVMASICRDAVTKWGGRVLILAHVKELLEQSADKLRLICPDVRVGLYSAGLDSRDTDEPIIVAGIKSVYTRACELGKFDLILIDECFTGDTLIDTPGGSVRIDSICVNQPVYNADGIGNVEAISIQNTNVIVKVTLNNGTQIKCTPKHPFFTCKGWVRADKLEGGDILFIRKKNVISSKYDTTTRRTESPNKKDQGSIQENKLPPCELSVEIVEIIQLKSPVSVYNLQVSGHPTYYAENVLVHNCHLLPPSGDGMYRQFFTGAKVVNPLIRLVGFTATPYRLSSGLLCGPDELLTEVCYEARIPELISGGYLCPLTTRVSKQDVDYSHLTISHGEYTSTEVDELVNTDWAVQLACKEIADYTQDREHVLLFAASVGHCKKIAKVLQSITGQEVGIVVGSTPGQERAKTLRRFTGNYTPDNLLNEPLKPLKYLVNVNVLTTGFDAPTIDCVALLRPTASPGLYYQQCGRGFRIAPGKKNTLILDFGGNILRHGPVDNIRIKSKSKGDGDAPIKPCPTCGLVVFAGVAICPDCGHEFPHNNNNNNTEISETHERAGVLTNEVNDVEHEVTRTNYAIWHKKGDPDGPATVRVEYQIGLDKFVSEWICPEHDGFARQKFVKWWREHTNEEIAESAEAVVTLANLGLLRDTKKITVRYTAGNKWPDVIGRELGDLPDASGHDLNLCFSCFEHNKGYCLKYKAPISSIHNCDNYLNAQDVPF